MTPAKSASLASRPSITQEQLNALIAAAGGAREVTDIYPASPLQRGLLFHSLYAPESSAYVVSAGWRLTGTLDVEAFKSAWRHLIERHSVLRTAFMGQELEAPLQLVRRRVELPFEYQDWRETAFSEQAERFDWLHQLERKRGFDFARPPLMRIVLIRTREAEHLMLWSHHHALLDGWSLPIVLNEFIACYLAFSRGELPRLAPVHPYRDYIAWLQQQDSRKAEAYWRARLQGFTNPTSLDVNRQSAGRALAASGSSTHTHAARMEPAVVESFVRQHKVTLNTLLLGVWSLLLARYSGSTDVVFGVTVAGRPRELADADSRVGLFINTLPFRAQINPRTSVLALLQELQVRQSELIEYQYSSLADIQRWSDVPPGTALFGTAFVFQNYPREVSAATVADPSLRVEHIVATERPHYSLVLRAGLREALLVNVIFDAEQIDAGAVERLVGHFETLLEGIVSDPGRPCAELQLLNGVERRRVLGQWDMTAKADSGQRRIDELFAEQAARTPTATAVIFDQRLLSYAELERRSNQLANYLQSLGVGPDVIVGVCVERSPEMVIGLLGILKAGGAYLPLDPQYPAQRLAFMLEDAKPPILLTQESLGDSLPANWARVVYLDRDWTRIAEEAATAPASDLAADNLAYVIYTSGSSGNPKGVFVEQGALACSMAARLQHYNHTIGELNEVDKHAMLLVTSCAFDSSLAAVLWTLLTGGRLVLPNSQEWADPNCLREKINAARITHWLSTTSLYRALLEACSEQQKLNLRCVIVGGESLQRQTVGLHVSRTNDAELHHEYGPTEATIWSTVATVDMQQVIAESIGSIAIGGPVAGAALYVLDEQLEPTPIGVAGELYVGGAIVARGYLNRPGSTAERFIAHPFGKGERVYCTGDLVRYREDGNLEFIGRRDSQVKLRGYRIELGEIEAALLEQEAIKGAVVVLREDQPTQKRLVGYVVAAQGQIDKNALRAQLQERLPDYMVPAAIVVLEALPLTVNGKVDRDALPAPEGRPDVGVLIAPRTPVEEKLAAIWREVLRLDQVGVEDNFFDLGGDSIQSIRIVARANQAGMKLTIRQMFDHQTIAGVAGVATAESAVVAEQSRVSGEVSLTPIQHWYLDHKPPQAHRYNQMFMLQPARALSAERLEQALGYLVDHHDALRLRFVLEGTGWRQTHAQESSPRLQRIDVSRLPAIDQMPALAQAGEGLQESVDLSQGPLLQAALFELGAARGQRLLLIIHHLVVDAVSWRVLLEDLRTAYEQLERGEAVRLPAKTSSFKQWSERLHGYATSEALRLEIPYWQALESANSTQLPVDHPDGVNTTASVRSLGVALSESQTRALLQEVPEVYHTQINDALLTSLAQALQDWTGGKRHCIALEGHGREELFPDMDVSRTVGWFTSVFPVVLELEEGSDSGTALKAVKEQLRAIPQRGIGYGIWRYLSGRSDEPRSGSEPQLAFNYLGQLDQDIADTGLLRPTAESVGSGGGGQGQRKHLIEVNGLVRGGRLQFRWLYSSAVHEHASIEALAQAFMGRLQALIAHCQRSEGGYTPSDFPLTRLSQDDLDQLIAANGGVSQVDDIYPASPLQQGLLFHSLYAPESTVYVVSIAWRLTGMLDVEAFKSAWRHLIERHAVLRTAFAGQELEAPVQVVQRGVELPLEFQDWRDLATTEQEARFEALHQSERRRGFEFTRAPLMRIVLIRTQDTEHRMVWSHHHAVLDGWSAPVLLNELFVCYLAFSRGQSPQLTSVRPYRDYIAWLRRQDLNKAEAYWRGRLQGFSAPTRLGVDRGGHRGDRSSAERHAEQGRAFSMALSALESFARDRKLTLNTLVLGAWSLVLSHYSGSADVVFGVTIAGRPAELTDAEQRVGLFINTLPLRVQVQGRVPVLSWLQELQRRQGELIEYQYTPLVDVQRWSGLETGTELFETAFVFENYPVEVATAKTMERSVGIANTRSIERPHYPLTLRVTARGSLFLHVIHDMDRFDAETVERLMVHLEHLLREVIAHPTRQVSELPLLTETERHRLLVQWNATRVSDPADDCVHELFSQQAARTPDAVALVFDGGTLSYAELERRSNQLAHHLRELGVRSDVIVGLCTCRSPQMVIGLLGILKAGGAYLPLDPRYPEQRIAFMLEDAGAAIVVTHHAARASCVGSTSTEVSLDDDQDRIGRYSETAPVRSINAANLAYVIYTSGSTGRPKGVMIQHASLTNYLHHAACAYDVSSRAGVPVNTALSFDATVTSVWVPLIQGRSVILLPEGSEELPALIAGLTPGAAGYSLVKVTPAHLGAMRGMQVTAAPAGGAGALVIGGEALTAAHVSWWRACAPQWRLINEYGPTEAVVGCAIYEIDSSASLQGAIPIGRPIRNVQLYVLNEELEPVPIGVAGELYIAGDGLARGYLNRPGLTAQRFIANPFGYGERLYRTGDVVRHRSDANLEFLGRCDDQVKVRGHRIELGEIEAALLSHPELRQAVVIAREDAPGQKQLVGYVVGSEASAPEGSELRVWLERVLPDYMVPSTFVALPALPLTQNDKVDRQALPAPQSRESTREYAAPRTAREATLAAIWRDVLRLESVGIHDDFLELGGDSIHSLRIVARARQAGVDLTVRQLFDQRTIARVAARSAAARANCAEQGEVVGPVPLTPVQHWYLDANPRDSHHFNQAILLKPTRRLSAPILQQALGQLLAHHDALRLTFGKSDLHWTQHNAGWDGQVPLERIDLSATPAAERTAELVRLADRLQADLQLHLSPLVRFALFELGPEDQRLLVVIHHLVADAMSWRILMEDLRTAYEQLEQGTSVLLPTKTTSYKSWAEHLQSYACSAELERELSDWQALLAHECTPLPVDHVAGTNDVASMRSISVALSEAETQLLLGTIPRVQGIQVNDVLLAGLALALQRWTGRDRHVVTLEGHGREELFEEVDVSRTVGWFTSVFPVVLDVAGSDSPADALRRVSRQLSSIRNRGIGYGVLRYLKPAAELAPTLQSQIIFNYLGHFDEDVLHTSLFDPAVEPTGSNISARGQRKHLIDVTGSVTRRRLLFTWYYSCEVHRQATIAEVAQYFADALRRLIQQ